jgi:hypothetical protein
MNRDENPYRPPALLSNDTPVSSSGRDLVARGRILYLGIVLFALFVLLAEILLTLAMGDKPNGVRVGLTLGLSFAGWRGHGWAIVLLVVGFALGALIGLLATWHLAALSSPGAMMLLLGVSVAYAGIAWALIRSESLHAFFKYQSRRRRRTPGEMLPEPAAVCGQASEEPAGSVDLVTVATFGHRAMADVCHIALNQAGIPAYLADDNVIGGVSGSPGPWASCPSTQPRQGQPQRASDSWQWMGLTGPALSAWSGRCSSSLGEEFFKETHSLAPEFGKEFSKELELRVRLPGEGVFLAFLGSVFSLGRDCFFPWGGSVSSSETLPGEGLFWRMTNRLFVLSLRPPPFETVSRSLLRSMLFNAAGT